MDDSWHMIGAGVCAVVILYLVFRFALSPKYPYTHRYILTKAELHFFKTLRQCIPGDCCLSVKPRLGDIIDVARTTKDSDPQWIRHYGAAIWSKHIDFVIFDAETAEVLLCIELDDSSHLSKDAKQRDQFKNKALAAAEIPLVRLPVKQRYRAADVTKKIQGYF